jgi:anaerobic magnesium-protoporphyrin IX monomethyl ester cyclase
MMRVVKARYPDIKIVCGGPHVTPFPRETLMKTGCDVCVIGEGEVTFLELIDRVRDIPGNIHDIKGIAYLDEGQYVQTETRRVIDDLDTVPIPDRDLVDQRDFVGLQYSRARPNTEMVITRGCPIRCVFCANPVFRLRNGPTFRCRSPQNIATEAEYLYQRGYREIYLHSDETQRQPRMVDRGVPGAGGAWSPRLVFPVQLAGDSVQ